MDSFRRVVAALFVCSMAPMLLYWPLLHGLVRLWRRLGPLVTFTVLWGSIAAVAFALYLERDWLLRHDLGTCWPSVGLGAICLVLAGRLRLRLRRDLPVRVMVGLPEVAPTSHPASLVRTGLYARVRHPRYLQLLLALLGWALVANHTAVYVVWGAWVLAIHGIVCLEERELTDRFGAAYAAYCREVPRYVPRRVRP